MKLNERMKEALDYDPEIEDLDNKLKEAYYAAFGEREESIETLLETPSPVKGSGVFADDRHTKHIVTAYADKSMAGIHHRGQKMRNFFGFPFHIEQLSFVLKYITSSSNNAFFLGKSSEMFTVNPVDKTVEPKVDKIFKEIKPTASSLYGAEADGVQKIIDKINEINTRQDLNEKEKRDKVVALEKDMFVKYKIKVKTIQTGPRRWAGKKSIMDELKSKKVEAKKGYPYSGKFVSSLDVDEVKKIFLKYVDYYNRFISNGGMEGNWEALVKEFRSDPLIIKSGFYYLFMSSPNTFMKLGKQKMTNKTGNIASNLSKLFRDLKKAEREGNDDEVTRLEQEIKVAEKGRREHGIQFYKNIAGFRQFYERWKDGTTINYNTLRCLLNVASIAESDWNPKLDKFSDNRYLLYKLFFNDRLPYYARIRGKELGLKVRTVNGEKVGGIATLNPITPESLWKNFITFGEHVVEDLRTKVFTFKREIVVDAESNKKEIKHTPVFDTSELFESLEFLKDPLMQEEPESEPLVQEKKEAFFKKVGTRIEQMKTAHEKGVEDKSDGLDYYRAKFIPTAGSTEKDDYYSYLNDIKTKNPDLWAKEDAMRKEFEKIRIREKSKVGEVIGESTIMEMAFAETDKQKVVYERYFRYLYTSFVQGQNAEFRKRKEKMSNIPKLYSVEMGGEPIQSGKDLPDNIVKDILTIIFDLLKAPKSKPLEVRLDLNYVRAIGTFADYHSAVGRKMQFGLPFIFHKDPALGEYPSIYEEWFTGKRASVSTRFKDYPESFSSLWEKYEKPFKENADKLEKNQMDALTTKDFIKLINDNPDLNIVNQEIKRKIGGEGVLKTEQDRLDMIAKIAKRVTEQHEEEKVKKGGLSNKEAISQFFVQLDILGQALVQEAWKYMTMITEPRPADWMPRALASAGIEREKTDVTLPEGVVKSKKEGDSLLSFLS